MYNDRPVFFVCTQPGLFGDRNAVIEICYVKDIYGRSTVATIACIGDNAGFSFIKGVWIRSTTIENIYVADNSIGGACMKNADTKSANIRNTLAENASIRDTDIQNVRIKYAQIGDIDIAVAKISYTGDIYAEWKSLQLFWLRRLVLEILLSEIFSLSEMLVSRVLVLLL